MKLARIERLQDIGFRFAVAVFNDTLVRTVKAYCATSFRYFTKAWKNLLQRVICIATVLTRVYILQWQMRKREQGQAPQSPEPPPLPSDPGAGGPEGRTPGADGANNCTRMRRGKSGVHLLTGIGLPVSSMGSKAARAGENAPSGPRKRSSTWWGAIGAQEPASSTAVATEDEAFCFAMTGSGF